MKERATFASSSDHNSVFLIRFRYLKILFGVFIYLFCRRLKRWIFDKQQKGAQGTRRHRHRSVGDAETNLPKNKKQQQQFAQAIQVRTLKMLAGYISKISIFKEVF